MTGRSDELDLVEGMVEVAGRALRILRPRDPEALLDERKFERDEFLPYWAELWPSGVALARAVAELDVAGSRVVELGCGLALPSLMAASRGADVLAVDWSEEAIGVLRKNARRNGVRVRTAIVDWQDAQVLVGEAPWDLVLAADVLYELRNVQPLLDLLPQLGAEALLADPSRPTADLFLERAAEGWQIDTRLDRIRPSVRIHRLLRRP